MVTFTEIIQRLGDLGITDVLLPFLLIFAIIYGILSTIRLFGENRNNINVIIALCMGLLVVVPHVTGGYPPGQDVVVIMNNAIPNVAIVVIAIIMMLMLMGVFGAYDIKKTSYVSGFILLASFLTIAFIFGNSAGWFNFGLPPFLDFLNDPDTQAMVLVILVFGVIVWFVTAPTGGNSNNPGFFSKMLEDLGKGYK
jgi:hypothetical protein